MKKRVKKIRKLGRSLGHRRLLVKNLVSDLIVHGRVKTTLAKAQVIRPVAEKLISKAKSPTAAGQRQIRSFFSKNSASQKLLSEIGPRFAKRPGGYTRIIKLGPRRTDAAPQAIIQLVE